MKLRYFDNKKTIVVDNNKKNTLVAVHGYNSSKDFIGKLKDHKENFNVLSFSLAGSLEKRIKNQTQIKNIRDEVIGYLKRLKHTDIYFLAHSFGGIIVNAVIDSLEPKMAKKVKGVVYLSTFHPYLEEYFGIRLLNTYARPQNNKEKIIAAGIKAGATIFNKVSKTKIDSFLTLDNDWLDMLYNVTTPKEIKNLDRQYKKNKDHSIYIVGDDDAIISTKLFVDYVHNSLGKEAIIVKAKHSPLKENFKEVIPHLNSFVPNKKRLFIWRNIYK